MALNTSQDSEIVSESVTENEGIVQQESETRKKLKSRKKKSYKRCVNNTTIVCVSPLPTIVNTSRKRHRSVIPVVSTMTAYEYYTPPLSHTVTFNEWSPIMNSLQIPRPIYTMAYRPLPVTVLRPRQALPRCPFTCAIMRPQLLTPVTIPIVMEIPSVVVTQPYVAEVSSVHSHIYEPIAHYSITETTEDPIPPICDEVYDEEAEEYTYDEISQANTCDGIPEENIHHETIEDNTQDIGVTDTDEEINIDPLERYLLLPRDLFPTTRMLAIDPNPLIDAFCNFKDLHGHVSWILDLEFGVPRHAVTRPLPMYNVKFYSIHCKNAPDAIHPGFESCSDDFKSALLFYYDYIVSSWYTGYMFLHNDRSIENFQSWLQLPMQMLGMCWP